MNTGQMLLVMGAIALLATFTVLATHIRLLSDRVQDETRIGMLGISLCCDQLDSLSAQPFDVLLPGSSTHSITTPIATFTCSTHVGYVSNINPDSLMIGPTDLKRIRIYMANAYLPGQILLQRTVGKF